MVSFRVEKWAKGRMTMNIRPTKHRLVVEVLEVRGLSENGMVVPDTVREWIPPTQGLVVGIGSEVKKTSVGERILYGLGAGEEYRGVLILHENDIICRMV